VGGIFEAGGEEGLCAIRAVLHQDRVVAQRDGQDVGWGRGWAALLRGRGRSCLELPSARIEAGAEGKRMAETYGLGFLVVSP